MPEEPYEWHKNGLSEDGAINLEAPRKWRLLRERTGHGAFHGMRIIVYGDCIAPPLVCLFGNINPIIYSKFLIMKSFFDKPFNNGWYSWLSFW